MDSGDDEDDGGTGRAVVQDSPSLVVDRSTVIVNGLVNEASRPRLINQQRAVPSEGPTAGVTGSRSQKHNNAIEICRSDDPKETTFQVSTGAEEKTFQVSTGASGASGASDLKDNHTGAKEFLSERQKRASEILNAADFQRARGVLVGQIPG